MAKPIGFMLDPANSCQLGCATCQNSFNTEYINKTYKLIPRKIMKANMFDRFMEDFGVNAFCGHFYNNHEPFLNKNTPAFIRAASEYRVDTLVSSNLSLPNLDADLIVASGLHTLMVAADGVTQESYSKYRRGGHLDLVFENVRKISEAKRRYGTPYPYLRWQYLTFKHNVHEIDAAIALAPDLGFDTINFATPFDVSADDPEVHAVSYDGPEEKKHVIFSPEPDLSFNTAIPTEKANHILALLHRDLSADSTLAKEPIIHSGSVPQSGMCDWLHLGVVVDAVGRMGSCCISDFKGAGRIYLGNLQDDGSQAFNSNLFVAARTKLNDSENYSKLMDGKAAEDRPFCEICTSRPMPQVGLHAASHYLRRNWRMHDSPEGLLAILTGWSSHQYDALRTEGESSTDVVCEPSITCSGQIDESAVRGLDAEFGNATVEEQTYMCRYPSATDIEDAVGFFIPLGKHAERRAQTGDARIVDLLVVPKDVVGKFGVIVKVFFESDIDAPIVGLTCSDIFGMQIIATNSLRDDIKLSSAKKSEVRFYRFDVELSGFRRTVSLEPAIAASTSKICDRRTNMLCVRN